VRQHVRSAEASGLRGVTSLCHFYSTAYPVSTTHLLDCGHRQPAATSAAAASSDTGCCCVGGVGSNANSISNSTATVSYSALRGRCHGLCSRSQDCVPGLWHARKCVQPSRVNFKEATCSSSSSASCTRPATSLRMFRSMLVSAMAAHRFVAVECYAYALMRSELCPADICRASLDRSWCCSILIFSVPAMLIG
jgi:hypothetical protein